MILKTVRFLFCLFFLIGCGAPTEKPPNVIGKEEPTDTIQDDSTPLIVELILPEGAVIGNYNGDLRPFYAYISEINNRSEITKVSFENHNYPDLSLPTTLGGTLSTLLLDGFDRDLLLVTSKLKDPNFNKYYLFILRDNQWKPVINGFAIHKSYLTDSIVPIQIDPENPKNMLRYYSVFDLDPESEKGYSWLLLQESVAIENW